MRRGGQGLPPQPGNATPGTACLLCGTCGRRARRQRRRRGWVQGPCCGTVLMGCVMEEGGLPPWRLDWLDYVCMCACEFASKPHTRT